MIENTNQAKVLVKTDVSKWVIEPIDVIKSKIAIIKNTKDIENIELILGDLGVKIIEVLNDINEL
jgi:hypothetical protein